MRCSIICEAQIERPTRGGLAESIKCFD